MLCWLNNLHMLSLSNLYYNESCAPSNVDWIYEWMATFQLSMLCPDDYIFWESVGKGSTVIFVRTALVYFWLSYTGNAAQQPFQNPCVVYITETGHGFLQYGHGKVMESWLVYFVAMLNLHFQAFIESICHLLIYSPFHGQYIFVILQHNHSH